MALPTARRTEGGLKLLLLCRLSSSSWIKGFGDRYLLCRTSSSRLAQDIASVWNSSLPRDKPNRPVPRDEPSVLAFNPPLGAWAGKAARLLVGSRKAAEDEDPLVKDEGWVRDAAVRSGVVAAAARSSCAAKVTSASLLQRLSLRFISWGSASSPCPPSLPHVSPAICPGEGGVGFGRKKEGLSPKQRVPAPPCSRSLYQRQPPPAPRYTRAPTIARGAAPLREVRAEALPDVVGGGASRRSSREIRPFRPERGLFRGDPAKMVGAGGGAGGSNRAPSSAGATRRGRDRRCRRGRPGLFPGAQGAALPCVLPGPELPRPG